jgi:uncharacterized protein (TIGR02996 family)
MNDDTFFQAVLDEPDNEELRLIYADWLEERSDPRGEFIRIQCRLARLPREAADLAELEGREKALWAEHRRTWNAPLHRRLAGTPLRNEVHGRHGLIRSWEYRRGFVEELTVQAEAFVDHGYALFLLGPLRHVRLWGVGAVVDRLARAADLSRLTGLELCRNDLDLEVRLLRLLASPQLGGLTRLNLRENGIGDGGVQAVARTRLLANLTFLGLGTNAISGGGVAMLAASPYLRGLVELDLRFNGIGVAGARALAGAKAFTPLRTLRLSGCQLDNEGVAALVQSPHLGNLTFLDLAANRVGDKGVEALVEAPSLGGLVELDLRDNLIGEKGLQALLRRGRLPRLAILHLGDSAPSSRFVVRPQTLRRLRKRFPQGL